MRYLRLERTMLCAALLIWLGGAVPVAAWEDDLHFGLTRWLALQAGYPEKFAQLLAVRDVGADEGMLDARVLVFWYACLSRDPGASEIVRTVHFPSDADVGPPRTRAVSPGGTAALREANREIDEVLSSDEQGRQASLRRFGRALHALQDSWSHQGEPAIPTGCAPDLAWGHPSPRGDWYRHRADLTYWWPADTMAAALATWDVLLRYAKRKPWAVVSEPKDWQSLEAAVESFGAANTKTAKLTWFRDHGFEDSIILYLTRTSLPNGGDGGFSPKSLPSAPANGPDVALGPVPPDAARALREFWDRWVRAHRDRDFAALASAYVSTPAFTRNLGIRGQPDEIVRTTLALWRLADHGLVEQLNHRPPAPGSSAEAEIRRHFAGPSPFIVTDGLPYAVLPIGKSRAPLALAPAGRNRYAAIGRFWHAPHDSVMTIAEKLGDRWAITELRSVVEH